MDEYCYRISAYPETFNDARDKCAEEGAYLGYVPSAKVQLALQDVIAEKKDKFSFFKDVTEFWLGAEPIGVLEGWTWIDHDKPMSVYSNWKSKLEGKYF